MTGVLQGILVLRPELFNIFTVGKMDNGTECTLSKFADDTKLCGAVNTLEGRDAIWRDLDRLDRTCVNLMNNKNTGKHVHQGRGTPKHKYRLGGERQQGLGLLLDEYLGMSQTCALAAQRRVLSWAAPKAVWLTGQER